MKRKERQETNEQRSKPLGILTVAYYNPYITAEDFIPAHIWLAFKERLVPFLEIPTCIKYLNIYIHILSINNMYLVKHICILYFILKYPSGGIPNLPLDFLWFPKVPLKTLDRYPLCLDSQTNVAMNTISARFHLHPIWCSISTKTCKMTLCIDHLTSLLKRQPLSWFVFGWEYNRFQITIDQKKGQETHH